MKTKITVRDASETTVIGTEITKEQPPASKQTKEVKGGTTNVDQT